MRIKFEKGMTPERIAQAFVDYVRSNDILIGAVNIYAQAYDDEMRPEKFNRGEEEYLVCSPSEASRREYADDVAAIRRKRMRAAG